MSSFSGFGLKAPILKALAEEGYSQPTPIQAQSIPDVMAGRDLLGIAQTGTGKTAAFALPILHRLAENPHTLQRRGCRALVLSPTRELASQIAESFQAYGRHLRLSTTVVFGGVPLGRQERALAQGVDILVATPGRLLDLIDRRALTISGVEIFVLDEADQMLDLGFIHALRRIVTMIPKQRQTLFFSATMPGTISGLADQLLGNPVKVSVTPVATTAERVEQSVIFVSTGDKQVLLRAMLEANGVERALVFTRTKHGADRVVRNLDRDGIQAAAIHGNKSQGQRERALADFKSGRSRVLVATDIAARGIDIDGVSHVINFDLPNVPESYVHRIGRTARAGAAGVAVSFCNGEERAYLRDIERLTRLKVPVAQPPAGFEQLAAAAPADVPRPAPAQPHRQPKRRPEGGRPAEAKGSGGARSHQGGRGRNGNGQSRPAAQNGQGRPAQARTGHEQARAPRPAQARPEARGGSREGGQLAWLERARRSPV
ncbi:DEAD/DEAH box helicase [Enterovirga aerilata]|uniref:DEAD-box ATP-dependent RNA helicase RhpA n=1 Tax=Enterovirga aerilata TaxID=2730920 RepID=A0A849IF80_9HYPH|nr:DEAD/DEAH box helicase [Enterovirga sp. DB1703]NNM74885.1 DEAD/DEAH box helicase [Enterovirga sp. DB1703]